MYLQLKQLGIICCSRMCIYARVFTRIHLMAGRVPVGSLRAAVAQQMEDTFIQNLRYAADVLSKVADAWRRSGPLFNGGSAEEPPGGTQHLNYSSHLIQPTVTRIIKHLCIYMEAE